MIFQNDPKKEWFQVTAVFGFFGDHAEAEQFRDRIRNEREYTSSQIKGSWH